MYSENGESLSDNKFSVRNTDKHISFCTAEHLVLLSHWFLPNGSGSGHISPQRTEVHCPDLCQTLNRHHLYKGHQHGTV